MVPSDESYALFSHQELAYLENSRAALRHCPCRPDHVWWCGMGGKSVFLFLANTLLFSDVLITALIMEKCYYHYGGRTPVHGQHCSGGDA